MSINLKKIGIVLVSIMASFIIGSFISCEFIHIIKTKELDNCWEEARVENKASSAELMEYAEILSEYRDMLDDKDNLDSERLNNLRNKKIELDSKKQ